jgi:hypothetical protein
MSRIGKKWEKEEDDELLTQIKTMSIEDIAFKHRRTETAIKSRLVSHGNKMIHKGASVESVAAQLKLQVDDFKPATAAAAPEIMDILVEIRDILRKIADTP